MDYHQSLCSAQATLTAVRLCLFKIQSRTELRAASLACSCRSRFSSLPSQELMHEASNHREADREAALTGGKPQSGQSRGINLRRVHARPIPA